MWRRGGKSVRAEREEFPQRASQAWVEGTVSDANPKVRNGWNERKILAGLALFSLTVWGFIELAEDAPAGEFLPLETRFLKALRTAADPAVGIGPRWLPETARDVTALGSAVVLTLLVAVVVATLLFRQRGRMAIFVVGATLGGWLVSDGLKTAIGRERPTIVPHLMEETSYSFPSGHTMLSSVVYFTLAAILARTVKHRWEKIFFVLLAAVLSGMIGISRLYLGVHYPTDVLAGWAAGTAWALFCGTVAWWWQRRGRLPGDQT